MYNFLKRLGGKLFSVTKQLERPPWSSKFVVFKGAALADVLKAKRKIKFETYSD